MVNFSCNINLFQSASEETVNALRQKLQNRSRLSSRERKSSRERQRSRESSLENLSRIDLGDSYKLF